MRTTALPTAEAPCMYARMNACAAPPGTAFANNGTLTNDGLLKMNMLKHGYGKALITFLSYAMIIAATPAKACDFCGCIYGINPFYNGTDCLFLNVMFQRSYPQGPLANLNQGVYNVPLKTLVGNRLLHHTLGGGTESAETRTTLELAYRHHFSQNLMATVTLPYVITKSESGTQRGAGDPVLTGYYVMPRVFGRATPVSLLLGAGLRIPVGGSAARDDGIGPAVDGIGRVQLVAQVQEWTVAADGTGTLSGADGAGRRRANGFSLQSGVSHDLLRNNQDLTAVTGNVGLRLEAAGQAKDQYGGTLEGSFSAVYATGGIQFVLDGVKLDAGVLIPVSQQRAGGQAYREGARLLTGIRYEF